MFLSEMSYLMKKLIWSLSLSERLIFNRCHAKCVISFSLLFHEPDGRSISNFYRFVSLCIDQSDETKLVAPSFKKLPTAVSYCAQSRHWRHRIKWRAVLNTCTPCVHGGLHEVLTLPATILLAKTNSVMLLKRSNQKQNLFTRQVN